MILWESANYNSSNDDSMVNEISASTKIIPAELRLMFQIEGDDNIYGLIHSCKDESRKHSVLSYVWKKEYVLKKSTSKSTNGNLQKRPVYQIIELKSIHSHCLLLPMDKDNSQTLQIVDSDKWGQAFYKIQ